MKCFVGLGNPGKDYMHNRHNVGFMAIDYFAKDLEIKKTQEKSKAWIVEAVYKNEKLLLIKPLTFMNLSGEAVRTVIDYYKLSIEDIIVLYDDLDTPFGQLRLRFQGSSGGHNGIKSIIQHMGTQQFNRIRIGVSRPLPGVDIAQYVLSDFPKAQSQPLQEVLERCKDAMIHSIHHRFEETMSVFNI